MLLLKSFIPDKKFVKRYLKIVGPIVIQQIFINSAIVIDNLMVGRLGQTPVLAIGAINAIHFFFMIAMFGITYGSSIYLSQYNGANKKKEMIATAGIKQQLLLIYSIITIAIIWIFASNLVKLFIQDIPENQEAIRLAIIYYKIFSISIIFKSQNYGYSTTFQELGQSDRGMKASSVSVIVNIVLNYFLIFGIWKFPALGLIGAAYGTVISKIASFLTWNFIIDTSLVMKNIFFVIFKTNKDIFKKVIRKSTPLFLSEILWSIAIVWKSKVFASFGANDFTAVTIQNNVETFVSVIWAGMWGGTVYLVGKKLGNNNLDHAKERALKLIGITFIVGIIISLVIIGSSIPMLSIYNVSPEIKSLAFKIILFLALFYPVRLLTGTFFFVIRTAGLVKETVKIDLIWAWLVMLPVLYLARYSWGLTILWTFFVVEITNVFKLTHACKTFASYKWLKSLIDT